jgi:hypothetical protein
VLSRSTENYDRGAKFELYQHLKTFQDFVIVFQTEAKIVHYVRQDGGLWSYRLLAGMGESLKLDSIGCTLPFSAIYRNVEFGPEEPAASDDSPSGRNGYRRLACRVGCAHQNKAVSTAHPAYSEESTLSAHLK